jgi:UDP-glucose 4-epimerase
MAKRKCLVVGGGGFIGSALVQLLVETGREVTVLGRKASPTCKLSDAANYVQCSPSEPQEQLKLILGTHPEIIYLAYTTVPSTSFSDPVFDLRENLPPAINLFAEVARTAGRLILISSGGTVYGEARSLPISENHPTEPISPYGVSKLMLEKYANMYAKTRGLQVVCVRPSNAYGQGQRPYAGQGFVATLIASALHGKTVTVFGAQETIRDYLHVSDMASGIMCALEWGVPGEIYNLGSGIGVKTADVLEAVDAIVRGWGFHIQPRFESRRAFDVLANVLDNSHLTNTTSWRPTIDFERGLHSTCVWLRNTL